MVYLRDIPAWFLPQEYTLWEGDIYNGGGEKIRADQIDTALVVAPNGSNTSLLITAFQDENGDTRYRQIDATPAVAVESDEKDMFTAIGDKGAVTVIANINVPVGSSATISCTVSGYWFRNSLKIHIASGH